MNLRIARKVLKNIEYTKALKYSAKQIDQAVQRVRRSLHRYTAKRMRKEGAR